MLNHGKREPGGLTASSPGDTLYFPFASYNDSGDSEVLSGLAVTDIEVIKNGAATVRATDSGYSLISDTGMVGDRAGLYRCSIQLFNTADDASFYASGSQYMAFIDAVTIDGKTVRFWLGSWEIGRQKVNTVELNGDTGSANWLKSSFANGFADTGLYSRIDKLAEDTGGVNVSSLSDTGINDRLAKILADTDTGIQSGVHVTSFSDTGVNNRLSVIAADTDTGIQSSVSVTSIIGNGIAASNLQQAFVDTPTYFQQVDVQKLDGDTGAANQLEVAFANGLNDTGLNDRLGRIGFDVDTGLRAQISDVDTGLHDAIADLDTGMRDHIDNTDTGLRARINTLAEDTGGVNVNSIAGDTGAAAHLAQAFAQQSTNSDTGLIQNAATIRSKTDSLTFTVANQVDANIQSVNDAAVTGTGASGSEWGPSS